MYLDDVEQDSYIIKKYIQLELARQNMSAFTLAVSNDKYHLGKFHQIICRELDQFLDDVANKKDPRLAIFAHPRSGKSKIVSEIFPSYAFGRMPDLQMISASYSLSLAKRANSGIQKIIEGNVYPEIFPDTQLASNKNRKLHSSHYARTEKILEIVGHQGRYRCDGILGGITGEGADILIIDDPVKNREEADSETYREKIWEEYVNTLYTRLHPGGGILLIMTRWHPDDLGGRILDNQDISGDKFKVLKFPAIATCDDEFRKAGDPLHPKRYGLKALERIKKVQGSRAWSALYQQEPTPDGGSIINPSWIKYYNAPDLPQKFDKQVMSWDMAFKANDSTDYVCGQLWGKDGANYYLLDQVYGRFSFIETLNEFILFTSKYPDVRTKLVEDKANGPAIIDTLKSSIHGIIPVTPNGSKISRVHSISPLFEAGNIFLPSPKIYSWVQDLVSELCAFPTVAHDDRTDALSQALNHLSSKKSKGMKIHPSIMSKLR